MKLHKFANQLRSLVAEESKMSHSEILPILEKGEQWKLGPSLPKGSIIFPHASMRVCGYQIAAAAQAALDSGADRLLLIGVLHALTDNLLNARDKMFKGIDVLNDPLRGIQGPGLNRGQEWIGEFSLKPFLFLLQEECNRRGCKIPEVIMRFPFLAAGSPESLPGIGELESLRSSCAILVTGDLMHHGIAYGADPSKALPMCDENTNMAKNKIDKGFSLLSEKAYHDYISHSWSIRSDASDVGQVLRHLIGPFTWNIHDIISVDTNYLYNHPLPNWVATSLVGIKGIKQLAGR